MIKVIYTKPTWVPIPYYYSSPLAKQKIGDSKTQHKLGFIPKYLLDARAKDTVNA